MEDKEGRFRVECIENVHYVTDMFCKYPLKLIAPKTKLDFSILYIMSYGGGLVSGDRVALDIIVGKNATLCIQSQGNTKIYKQIPGKPATQQKLDVEVGTNALCLLLQDPVQPFGDSNYIQTQNFVLEDETSSLALLDWTLHGRSHINEQWSMRSYVSKNCIQMKIPASNQRKTLLRDVLKIFDEPNLHIGLKAERMHHFECIGNLYLLGPKFLKTKEAVLNQYRNKEKRISKTTDSSQMKKIIWTACELRSVTIIKFAAYNTETARNFLLKLFSDYASFLDHETLRAFWY